MSIKSRMEELGYTHEEIDQVLEELADRDRQERINREFIEEITREHPRAHPWPFPSRDFKHPKSYE